MCSLECDFPSVFWVTTPKARKQHVCCECGSIIEIGEEYEESKGVWDGYFSTYKTCKFCANVRAFARYDEHFEDCISFGALWEVVGPDYGVNVMVP